MAIITAPRRHTSSICLNLRVDFVNAIVYKKYIDVRISQSETSALIDTQYHHVQCASQLRRCTLSNATR